jgi:hypothetical protein
MLAVGTIFPQQAVGYRLECGAAGRIYQLGSLAYKIDKLANSPEVHASMVKAAQELTKYRAADIIAESVLRDLRGE